MLMKSLSLVPLLWCSWKELTKLCDDREMVGQVFYHGIFLWLYFFSALKKKEGEKREHLIFD